MSLLQYAGKKLFFTLPNGNHVGFRCYIDSWKTLKALPPDEEIKGWEWYPCKAALILRSISDGVQDRINKRGGLLIREISSRRLGLLITKHRLKA